MVHRFCLLLRWSDIYNTTYQLFFLVKSVIKVSIDYSSMSSTLSSTTTSCSIGGASGRRIKAPPLPRSFDTHTMSSVECSDSVSVAGDRRRRFNSTCGGAVKLRLPPNTVEQLRQSVSDDDSGCAIDDYRFAWVPRNMDAELVTYYLYEN